MTPAVRTRWLALLEVVCAFAVMHVGFRLIKRFTAWGSWEYAQGMNFSPGFMMVTIAGPMLWWHVRRRRLAATSTSATATSSSATAAASARSSERGLAASINSAWVCLLLLFLTGGVLLTVGISGQGSQHTWPAALILCGASFFVTWLMLRCLSLRFPPLQSKRTTVLLARIGVVVFLTLLALPTLLALRRGDSASHEILTTLWILLGAGLGEELFFRGYLQTRLNHAFGRPWQLVGVRFGPGLLLASALFGMVHALNPVDYFQGGFDFAWQHGLMTASALHYGFLRERTGGILAPMVVHVVVNLGGQLLANS